MTSRGIPAWSEDALTARVRAVWSGPDYRPIARGFGPAAAGFALRLRLRRGETVLDVGCGTGNVAIAAAQAGAIVTGLDIAPNLVAQARLDARTVDCPVEFDVGDAEAMPYGAGRFDTTVSMFGAMFACRPERAASELLRVTRRGGRVVMANWTPGGFLGEFLQAHDTAAPPPAEVPSPLEWGRAGVVRERFGRRVTGLACTPQSLELRFPLPPPAVTELFATCFGPTVAALQAVGPAGASRFRSMLTGLLEQHNRATDGTTVVAGEYLDVQALVA
jgi:SAM-dependent methyltransferase